MFLNACSNAGDETHLVDLHTAASQDIISINFPADTESIISINSQYNFSLEGQKSNGVDTITNDIQWSLSDGAISTINQSGHFTASANAELITVTAQFGFLSESIDIKVSSAAFDQVVQLDENTLVVDMCRSQVLTPIGSYIDDNGNEEIRPVDNITINTIDWIVLNQEDNNSSQRAYIEILDSQAYLHTLAEGNIIIQAKAFSQVSDSEVTSVDFDQAITNNLNSIKLCYSNASDLANCFVAEASVEKGKTISLISVGNYQALDGSDFDENITANSQWGVEDVSNASIALSTDRQQLDITGEIEESSTIVSVACGEIEQAIDSIDISQGVILDTSVSCSSDISCLTTSTSISIDQLTVTSLSVSANDTDLISSESLTLSVRPDEISLIITASFTDNTQTNITNDSDLISSITAGKDDVIEEITDSPGIYTVLGSGTAEIKLDFRGETFYALIEIP